jgi:hypothetical protein
MIHGSLHGNDTANGIPDQKSGTANHFPTKICNLLPPRFKGVLNLNTWSGFG